MKLQTRYSGAVSLHAGLAGTLQCRHNKGRPKMQTRAEHLEWCKQRAREYCERGDAQNALTSMFSDLDKHPETAGHKGTEIGLMMMLGGMLNTPHEARRFIDGFN